MYNVYGLNWCVFCVRAINLLHENSKDFSYNSMDGKDRILKYIKETYNHKTVPVITLEADGKEILIGGYDDLVKHIREQKDEESNNSNS